MKTNNKFKIALWLLISTFFIYSFFQFLGFQGYESETYDRIVKNLEAGEFKTMRSGYAQTVLETPFVWKGLVLGNFLGDRHHQTSQLFAQLYNPFITALSVVVMFLIFNLLVSKRKSFWLSIIYAFGTMAFPYATIGMEPTAVLFVLLATYFLFRFGKNKSNKDVVLSGLFYFLLFFSKAYYFVTLPAFLGYIFLLIPLRPAAREQRGASPQLRGGKSQVFSPSIEGEMKEGVGFKKFIYNCIYFTSPLLIIFPLYLLANKYNFGNYFGGQYNLREELLGGESIIFGIYGLLLSFGKSIFIYSPVLVLSAILFKRFYNQFKKEALFVILYSLFLTLFIASKHWWSDETWGPRYLLSLSAIGSLPLVELPKLYQELRITSYLLIGQAGRLLITVVLAFSFTFQLLGVLVRYDVFPYTFYEIYGNTGYNVLASQEYQYIPQFAPYLVNYQLLKNKILGSNEPVRYNIIYSPPMEEAAKIQGKPVIKEITYDNNKYQAHALNFWWNNLSIISANTILFFYLLAFFGLAAWGRNVLKSKKEQ